MTFQCPECRCPPNCVCCEPGRCRCAEPEPASPFDQVEGDETAEIYSPAWLGTGPETVTPKDRAGWPKCPSYFGTLAKPAYGLYTHEGKLVASCRADSAQEARSKFRTLPEWARPNAARVKKLGS